MRVFIMMFLLLAPLLGHAELRVFSCEPEWAALAEEIGGDLVEAYSATTALQDPHYIQARPSLIAKLRRANLLICSGAQLEIGWLPALLQKANNRDVRPGSRGYMEASNFVVRLDATGSTDRAKGDIHPRGNPHVQTNPHNVAAVAEVLAKRMAELDAENALVYESRNADFLLRWQQAIVRWELKAAPLRGIRAITHHKSWVYLERWLGIVEVGNLEAVPGLPPTATHLSRLTKEFADGGADVIVRAPYQDAKPSQWLAERTGITAVVLPLTVGGTDGATDLFSLYDDIVDRLLGATQ
jgi:zinc/manganese transport system substrate-binding protein